MNLYDLISTFLYDLLGAGRGGASVFVFSSKHRFMYDSLRMYSYI